jgi:hypothetical protein
MSSRGQTPPTTKARVVLQPVKTQKPGRLNAGEAEPRNEETERTEEEEKDTKQKTRPVPDTTRPIPDIRVQAGDIERKVLAFCFDPSKNINKEQAATIMRHFKDMRGIVEKLLLQNS